MPDEEFDDRFLAALDDPEVLVRELNRIANEGLRDPKDAWFLGIATVAVMKEAADGG